MLAGGGEPANPDPADIVGFHLWGCVTEPYILHPGIGSSRTCVHVSEVLAQGSLAPASAKDLHRRLRTAAPENLRAHLVADVEVGGIPFRRDRQVGCPNAQKLMLPGSCVHLLNKVLFNS